MSCVFCSAGCLPGISCLLGCTFNCLPGISCLIPCSPSCIFGCGPTNTPGCGAVPCAPVCGPTNTPGCGAAPCAPVCEPVCQPNCTYNNAMNNAENGNPNPMPCVNPATGAPLDPIAKAALTGTASAVAKNVIGSLLNPCTPAKTAKTSGNVGSALTSSGLSSLGGSLGGSSGGGGALPTPLQGGSLAGAPAYGLNSNILKPLTQLRASETGNPLLTQSDISNLASPATQAGTGMPAQAVGGSSANPYSSLVQTLFAGQDKNPSPMMPVAAEGGSQGDILKRWQDQQSKAKSGALMSSGLKMLGATPFKTGGHAEHNPEFITGATGHYVKGKGDGQSDDIPAMLADGEYVFDADTVAALGNGSSDAGAKLLDHFRESLREHKRSAASDKIPPKASPLAYMKEALKRHSKG